jgi:hypothetical protein
MNWRCRFAPRIGVRGQDCQEKIYILGHSWVFPPTDAGGKRRHIDAQIRPKLTAAHQQPARPGPHCSQRLAPASGNSLSSAHAASIAASFAGWGKRLSPDVVSDVEVLRDDPHRASQPRNGKHVPPPTSRASALPQCARVRAGIVRRPSEQRSGVHDHPRRDVQSTPDVSLGDCSCLARSAVRSTPLPGWMSD